MRIALAQMTSGTDPAQNLSVIADHAATAARGGAVLLSTPEMALLLDSNRTRAAAHLTTQADSPWPDALSAIARDHAIWLHLGSAPFLTGDAQEDQRRSANRSLLFAPDGRLVARYDKLHMFDVALSTGESWCESAAYRAGDRAVVAAAGAARLGLAICYDLRFGDLFSHLALAGANVILVPAAFTVPTGRAHWHVLLRARAIETGCFIVAAAQSGTHADGRATFGHSLVISPWGEILLDAGDPPGLYLADIDLGQVDTVRAQIPALSHRRTIPDVEQAS